ncbi:MAG: CvpA family protein [Candidatus Woesebacteria bacterium]|nr:MAG: CvpA family protein [Candidatus Woesebacteria bacterium]
MNIPSLQGNWVDLIILGIIIFFVFEGFQIGFWVSLAELISLVGSFSISLWLYKFGANLIKTNFSLSNSVSNVISFLVISILMQGVLSFLFLSLISKIPKKYLLGIWVRILSIIPSFLQSLVLISFFLTLILGLPITPKIKGDISNSKIGGSLITQMSFVESKFDEVFGGLIKDTLTYLTVEPGTRESVSLNVDNKVLTVDENSETEMFKLVNSERQKRGISNLTWDSDIVPVARGHATDMWERKYFSHYSPEGEDVGDRLNKVGIIYSFAGENLALAPTLSTAHQGLMNSEGHRENILDKRFKKIGIGVIDNGVYGKMFVQVFID